MKHEFGEIKKVIKVGQIEEDFFAYCLCSADGKEFYRSIPNQSWPIHHLPKIIGMRIIFVKIKGSKYELLPLNFQPLFVTLEFLHRLIHHGEEDLLEIIRKSQEDEKKYRDLNIEERLEISRREIELYNNYINQTENGENDIGKDDEVDKDDDTEDSDF